MSFDCLSWKGGVLGLANCMIPLVVMLLSNHSTKPMILQLLLMHPHIICLYCCLQSKMICQNQIQSYRWHWREGLVEGGDCG